MQKKDLKIHFIAMEDSLIYNLAAALHLNGHTITGSYDQLVTSKRIVEPGGILPEKPGWFPEKISKEIDSIIVGSHVEKDNPELKKAKELGLKIYSFPEYIYRYAKDKQRIVIAGTYGKTAISAIISYVLKYWNRRFDYVISSPIKQGEIIIKLSDAPIIILEGSAYPTSSIDATPVFLHYRHNIGLISNIVWDHLNIYPDFDTYGRQFDAFADASPKGGILIYCKEDALATVIGSKERPDVQSEKYSTHPYEYVAGQCYLTIPQKEKIPVQRFDQHYMCNIAGAQKVLKNIGITSRQFYEAIASFQGVHDALALIAKNYHTALPHDHL